MKRIHTVFFAVLFSLTVSGCSYANERSGESTAEKSNVIETAEKRIISPTASNTAPVTEGPAYIDPAGAVLQERFITPEGYKRRQATQDSFEAFLRNYPMKQDKSSVLLYDGTEKGNQNAHEAVFSMHIEPEDFQQCADSVMRIYAEYLYGSGAYDKIRFHLVSGFMFDFNTWRKGNKLVINGDNAAWGTNAANDSSPESFERYLRILFAYASTLSMQKESMQADISDLQIGDIFIKGGSPGHVVMVADVCENEAGEKAFLLAQGYMPAQEFHILKNPLHQDNPWYYVSEITYPFVTPEYRFDEGSFRRPPYLNER